MMRSAILHIASYQDDGLPILTPVGLDTDLSITAGTPMQAKCYQQVQ